MSRNLRRLSDEWTADDESLVQAIDDATATPIEITRHLAPDWFAGVETSIDELEDRAVRRPEIVLALTEHLLLRLDQALGAVDDSDGGA